MSMMTSVPRAVQLLDREPGQLLLISSLEQEFKHYLKQVHRHTFHLDRRYTQTQYFTSSMAWSKTSKDFCSRFTDAYFTRVAYTHRARIHLFILPVAKRFKQCLPTHILQKAKPQLTHTHAHTLVDTDIVSLFCLTFIGILKSRSLIKWANQWWCTGE